MNVITTTFRPAGLKRVARIQASRHPHRVVLPYDHALSQRENHVAAAAELVARHFPTAPAQQLVSSEVPGAAAWVHVQSPLPAALAGLTAWCVSGGRYERRNPYAVPQIAKALSALSENAGFVGVPDMPPAVPAPADALLAAAEALLRVYAPAGEQPSHLPYRGSGDAVQIREMWVQLARAVASGR